MHPEKLPEQIVFDFEWAVVLFCDSNVLGEEFSI